MRSNARWAALFTTVATFLLSLWPGGGSTRPAPPSSSSRRHAWLADTIRFKLGVDGFSMPFVLLTTFLMPFCILASWESIEHRLKEYMVAFLVLETTMIGVFVALDLVLFYLFFEAGLIPMFLIIGIWGGKRRIYASFKFFLYTLLGSVLMLLAIMAMYWNAGTTDIPTLLPAPLPVGPADLALARLLRLLRGEDADVAGPHLAAGRACRGADRGLGDPRRHPPQDGRLRLHPLLDPDVPGRLGRISRRSSTRCRSSPSSTPRSSRSMQEDMKKLIAYSSVAHMGFVTMGLFTLTPQGIQGAMFQMISHGLVSGALFLCVGVIYDRMHTREIAAYGGLVNRMPLYAVAFMVFTWPMSACPAPRASSASSWRLSAPSGPTPGSPSSPRPASSCRRPTCSGSTAA